MRYDDSDGEDTQDQEDESPGGAPSEHTEHSDPDLGPDPFDIEREYEEFHIPAWIKVGGVILVLLGVLGIVLSTLGPAAFAGADRERNARSSTSLVEEGAVQEALDGATIVVRLDGEEREVAYIGVSLDGLDAQQRGAALRANRQLVAGEQVTLEPDSVTKDSEGRLLRYVYADGSMVNGILIVNGLAKHEAGSENARFQSQLERAELDAQRNGRGIWRENADLALSGYARP
ncbi:MAG: thermonuclease family protein [Chloroflexota bacterium]